jgi:hypothetical protein
MEALSSSIASTTWSVSIGNGMMQRMTALQQGHHW